jgi:brefeldin A-resistance guanine nucleotide exchange factor 1
MLRRPRTSSQHATRGGHSDDDEDEGVPASYHTVSLQVSQDVSMAPFTFSPPLSLRLGAWAGPGKARTTKRKGPYVLP